MPPENGPDLVAESCDELARYMALLEGLLAEAPQVAGGAAPALHGRRATPPLPGHQQAFYALMTAHEGLRRLEAVLRAAATGQPAGLRGTATASITRILAQLPRFAATLDAGNRDMALRYLGRWIGEAKAVHGVDEARRWRHLPRPRPGQDKPPRCPNCSCYQLVADVEAGIVACSVPGCQDKNGVPPVAAMTTDQTGRPVLAWADGTVEPGVTL